jgi:hypothetical protein
MIRKRQGLIPRPKAAYEYLSPRQKRFLKHRASKRERRRRLEGETDE